ncbi:MAG: hypothetical protein ACK41U_11765, partial [Paracoccus sp. (in: a-proteobacteria)]|uniref:hypothetical protein n=1 Tax=Paracoccus sp. TaxID=267 RepID=UPI00391B99E2
MARDPFVAFRSLRRVVTCASLARSGSTGVAATADRAPEACLPAAAVADCRSVAVYPFGVILRRLLQCPHIQVHPMRDPLFRMALV